MKAATITRVVAERVGWRRACIGIGVGCTSVRVALVKSGQVQWRGSRTFGSHAELIDSLVDLLIQMPASRKTRRAIAAIGPHNAQVKALRGLPSAARSSWLNAAVNENRERFYLGASDSTVSGRLYTDGHGQVWGAAIDGVIVDALSTACRSAAIALVRVVPTAWVLPNVAGDEHLEWLDGEAKLSIDSVNGVPTAVRRTRTAKESIAILPTQLDANLRVLGSDAWAFADAYGALASQGKEALSIAPAPIADEALGSRWRNAAIIAFLITALVHLAVGPVLVARMSARQAPAPKTHTAAQAAEARRLIAAMRSSSRASAELREFRRNRISVVSLLGALGDALPEGAFATSAQIRAGQGRVEIGAADASTAIEALQGSDSLADVTLDGPVTSELQGASRRDRAVVRFRWKSRAALRNPIPRAARMRE